MRPKLSLLLLGLLWASASFQTPLRASQGFVAVNARMDHRISLGGGALHNRDMLIFAPSGDTLISVNRDFESNISIWSTRTGEKLAGLDYPGSLTDAALSPDGKVLVTADSEKRLTVWRMADGAALHHLPSPMESDAVAFSPDGKWLAVAAAGKGPAVLTIWDVKRWTPAHRMKLTGAWWGAVAFSHDGRTLAAAAEGNSLVTRSRSIQLWRVPSWASISRRPIQHQGFLIDGVAFSPDDHFLWCADGDSIDLREILTWRHIEPEPGIRKSGSATFSPDGRLFVAAGGDGGAIGICSTRTWKRICILGSHTGE